MYEYSTINGVVEITNPKAKGDEIASEITIKFGKWLEEFPSNSEKLRGGGWEIVSHDFCLMGKHLVVSLLLRRLKN